MGDAQVDQLDVVEATNACDHGTGQIQCKGCKCSIGRATRPTTSARNMGTTYHGKDPKVATRRALYRDGATEGF